MKRKTYLSFFIATLSFFASQAQQASRLIALTKTAYDPLSATFLLQDSAAYMHHGTEDTTNDGSLAFDSSYLFGYRDSITINNQSYRSYQTLTNNNLTTTLTQWYDTSAGAWKNYTLNNATYNADSNLTERITQTRDSIGLAWKNSTQIINTYAGTNLTIEVKQNWIIALNAWRNNLKDSFEFDPNNNSIYHLQQNWDTINNVWANSTLVNSSYTGINQIIDAEHQVWDPISLSWTYSLNDLYSYDAQDLLQNTIVQRLDSITGDWRNAAEDSLVRNGAGDIVAEYKNVWDTINSVWRNNNLQEYTYDVSHNNLTDTQFTWNNSNAIYKYNVLSTYTYNTFNQVLNYTTSSWNIPTATWIEKGADLQYRYYYETFTDTVSHTGIQTITAGTLSAYPVPTQSQLNIILNWTQPQAFTIGIYDIAGELVRQWGGEADATTYRQTIPVSDLAPGNYFIKAAGSKQQIIQKFVITR